MFCKDLERLVYSTRTSFLVVMKQGNEIIIKTMKNGDVVFTVDMGGECSAVCSIYDVKNAFNLKE
ncbi:MAG: hypothetical protein IJ366_03975 [Clostridia bacterium]|nr:hypothetical protein [Clostridia bacterium]